MSVFDRKLLIPPIVYSKCSDDNWEKIFGRVNTRSKTSDDVEKKHGRTYMERMMTHLRTHATKEKSKEEV